MIRQRFDRIEIFDLRGDVRTGERADVEGDQGVFNIKVGTAITLAIADGSKAEGELADVFYSDSWADDLFSRDAKFGRLRERAQVGTMPNAVLVRRGPLDDMRPEPFQTGEWIDLRECFDFHWSGIQTKRDDFIYSPDQAVLAQRLTDFHLMPPEAAAAAFPSTDARPWNLAHAVVFSEERIERTAYRPLDRRYLYNITAFIDRPRPELQRVWGANNTGLYAMPLGTGAGPAVWCHALLPDYHALAGAADMRFHCMTEGRRWMHLTSSRRY